MPEITLTRRQLEATAGRKLQAQAVSDACYEACRQKLAPDNGAWMGIYVKRLQSACLVVLGLSDTFSPTPNRPSTEYFLFNIYMNAANQQTW
jgi:hypothetical protein